ncbi:hypothetical protein vseg_017256 [Gypsophila vaccaria]
MGTDYYKILNVPKKSSEEEIRRSYKKLAMAWHPDKHPSDIKSVAEQKFKTICEAYDVLSDPNKRHMYDLYGDDSLKYDVSSPSAPSDEDLIDEFFDGFGNYDDIKEGKYGKNSQYRRNCSFVSKAEGIEKTLGCSLEELYKGSMRKMVISRIVPDAFGKPTTMEELLAIDIKPGWKKGTKITFSEKGNQGTGLIPGDLIFVVDEKPHPTYTREGNDLVTVQKISLVEALTGMTLNLTTLDGRNLVIDVSDVVSPGCEIVIPGEGMPLSKEPRKKGNLIIMFDVVFPSRLSSDQKGHIRRALT